MKKFNTRYFWITTESRIANDQESRETPSGCVIINDLSYPNIPRFEATYSRYIRGESGELTNVAVTRPIAEGTKTVSVYGESPIKALKALKAYIRKNGVR